MGLLPSDQRKRGARALSDEPGLAGEVAAALRVAYGDVDRMGVVYYANYLRWFELGRAEYLRARGRPYKTIEEQDRVRMPVVEAYAHYQRSALYDDVLEVRARVVDVGHVRAKFAYRVVRPADGALLAEGYTVHGCVDERGKLQRLPAAVRLALGAREARDARD